MSETATRPEPWPSEGIGNVLRSGLAFLPGLIVAPVPMGYAVSSSAWPWEDGDRCTAYVGRTDTGWRVEDSGDTFGWRCDLDDPRVRSAIGEAGMREEDFTLTLDVLSAAELPAAVVQMLSTLWRLSAIAGTRIGNPIPAIGNPR